MECMYLSPFARASARRRRRSTGSDFDEDWTNAPELGLLARVFNQDTFNLPKVQRGLRTTDKPGVTLANYQETKIRHFHGLLERQLGLDL